MVDIIASLLKGCTQAGYIISVACRCLHCWSVRLCLRWHCLSVRYSTAQSKHCCIEADADLHETDDLQCP